MTGRLDRIGDDLERAAAKDLRGHRRPRRRDPGARPPGAALAGSLLTTEDVERSLPAGTRFLIGTTPECTAITEGVEYRCTIEGDFDADIEDLKGTVEPTLDATQHVNGGCRSLRADGREWRCCIGQEAVRQRIVSADFLGEYAPAPGVG